MNIRTILIASVILLLPVYCPAQDLNNKILMSVDGRGIQAGEFMRMYNKSQEPGQAEDIDNYLKQFTLFKLKVADAIRSGYDTTKSFRTELTGYRNQLAQSMLTDSQAKEKLLQKAYQRSLTEINAWHILVALPQEASPEDTLKAWQKASDIRERIVKGESFEEVARGTSDDQSVKVNGGNLGYFTVFQMIMPFEDAAYNLKKGAISDPVRTPYGYHIIKNVNKRPSKGKVMVAHIMKVAPPGTGEAEAAKAEEEINGIYKKLLAGESFSDLAKKYSDHKESAINGGKLDWFGTGEIISDFSEAAFSIPDTGKYTNPVRTLYGWHIIKLLARKIPGSYEETKSYLESKLNQSYLNSVSKKTFTEKLKKEYKYKINQEAYDWFVLNTDTLIIQALRKYDRTTMPAGNLYSFANQNYSTREFANYIEKRGSVFISRTLETRLSDHLISYENSVLEKKYPDFRYLMNEFHDGILLFEISGKKVWNRVNEDSVGLQRYYEANKNKFLTKKGIAARMYTLKKDGAEKELAAAYKKATGKPDMDRRLLEKFNKKSKTILSIADTVFFKGDNTSIDKLNWKEGYQSVSQDSFPSIIFIKNVIEPKPLKFAEVQGEMLTGYQEFLEKEWSEQLKEKYAVKIDNSVLEEVKKILKK